MTSDGGTGRNDEAERNDEAGRQNGAEPQGEQTADREKPATAPRPKAGGRPTGVVPKRAAEDDPRTWGDAESGNDHDAWLKEQKPPHWG